MRTGASSWSSNQGDAVEDDARGAREEARAPRETETLDAPGDAIARTLARRTESAQPPPRARADAGEGRGRETLATTRDRVDEDRRHTDGAARSAPPTASAASGAMRSPAAPRSDVRSEAVGGKNERRAAVDSRQSGTDVRARRASGFGRSENWRAPRFAPRRRARG